MAPDFWVHSLLWSSFCQDLAGVPNLYQFQAQERGKMMDFFFVFLRLYDLFTLLPSLSPFTLILLLLFPSSFLFSYLPPFLSPVLPISPPRFFLFAPPPSLPLAPSAFQDVEFPDHNWYFSTD